MHSEIDTPLHPEAWKYKYWREVCGYSISSQPGHSHYRYLRSRARKRFLLVLDTLFVTLLSCSIICIIVFSVMGGF